jgi:bifunctional DNase/RNase
MSSKPLELEGLGVESRSGTPVILLREPQSDTRIPIWIGQQEAMAIAAELEEVTPPRPLTHDLMITFIRHVGFQIEYVEISDLKDGTFYAEIRLVRGDELITLDSRPSDAIALAVRVGCKLRVNERVLTELGKGGTPSSDEERWTELARSLTADDFGKFKQ